MLRVFFKYNISKEITFQAGFFPASNFAFGKAENVKVENVLSSMATFCKLSANLGFEVKDEIFENLTKIERSNITLMHICWLFVDFRKGNRLSIFGLFGNRVGNSDTDIYTSTLNHSKV